MLHGPCACLVLVTGGVQELCQIHLSISMAYVAATAGAMLKIAPVNAGMHACQIASLTSYLNYVHSHVNCLHEATTCTSACMCAPCVMTILQHRCLLSWPCWLVRAICVCIFCTLPVMLELSDELIDKHR